MYQETLLLDYQNERGKKIRNYGLESWNWWIVLCHQQFSMDALFLEDFVEVLISNGLYMIIKNGKIGEFGIIQIILKPVCSCLQVSKIGEKWI